MYPHRIRLRGPWDCQPLDPPGPAFRAAMPCRLDQAGRLRCRRHFGYPGRIDAHERVWLVLDGVAGRAAVSLNGTPLGACASGSAEFEVTDRLGPRNELVVEAESPGSREPWEEVALEVRCTAYLRNVRAWVGEEDGITLHAGGEVVGRADGPLDLYLILGRSPLTETRAEAEPAGRPFHLAAAVGDRDRLAEPVRVELVNGATVWFSTEVGVAGRQA
jgi:hypothetical protein